VYLSTVSEPLEKILRYGQSLSFFDASAIGRSVIYEDLGESLSHQDALTETLGRVVAILRERRPGFLVIDSFKAMRPFAEDASEFRRFLQDLAGTLTAYPATSLWVGEYGPDEIAAAPEFAVADGIISLAVEPTADRETRVLQVQKLRGSGFLSGKHAYRLSTTGSASSEAGRPAGPGRVHPGDRARLLGDPRPGRRVGLRPVGGRARRSSRVRPARVRP
jgi:circadian clock protein KaiC